MLHVVLAFWAGLVCCSLRERQRAAGGRAENAAASSASSPHRPIDVEMTAVAAKARARGGGQKTTKLRPRGPEVRVRVPRFGG